MTLWVKICGITSPEDARAALEAGADAIGVNLVKSSRRCVDVETARRLRETVGDRAEVILVVADRTTAELSELREQTGIRWLQLHGSESADELARLLPDAYKAMRVAERSDLPGLGAYAGSRLLVDAKVQGELGGTGRTFDWSLVTELAKQRALVVAGGLTPDNVGEAVRYVRPYGVDTASGVEGPDPRRKDVDKMTRFVRAARAALLGLTVLAVPALFGCSSSDKARELVAPDTPLPGVVAGLFEAKRCSDATGAPLELGPRLFVALAPPGLVEKTGKLSRGAYPAGVVTLLDQRVGYEGVLLAQARQEGRSLVYRTEWKSHDGLERLEEIRLPVDLASAGTLELVDPSAPGSPQKAGSPPVRQVLSRCELVVLGPGLDRPERVDYEPGRAARHAAAPPSKAP